MKPPLDDVDLELLSRFDRSSHDTLNALHDLALRAVSEIRSRRAGDVWLQSDGSARRVTIANTSPAEPRREAISPGYEQLAKVHDEALRQAQSGKGRDRHSSGEPFHDQQIVQLGEWMGGSTVFAIGQACKKAIESTRLDDARARAELLGGINYLSAAVILLDRRNGAK